MARVYSRCILGVFFLCFGNIKKQGLKKSLQFLFQKLVGQPEDLGRDALPLLF